MRNGHPLHHTLALLPLLGAALAAPQLASATSAGVIRIHNQDCNSADANGVRIRHFDPKAPGNGDCAVCKNDKLQAYNPRLIERRGVQICGGDTARVQLR